VALVNPGEAKFSKLLGALTLEGFAGAINIGGTTHVADGEKGGLVGTTEVHMLVLEATGTVVMGWSGMDRAEPDLVAIAIVHLNGTRFATWLAVTRDGRWSELVGSEITLWIVPRAPSTWMLHGRSLWGLLGTGLFSRWLFGNSSLNGKSLETTSPNRDDRSEANSKTFQVPGREHLADEASQTWLQRKPDLEIGDSECWFGTGRGQRGGYGGIHRRGQRGGSVG